MPQSAPLSNGVWLEIQIFDGSSEVVSTARNTTGLMHRLHVAWRHSWRAADVRVTHDIVRGVGLVTYTHVSTPWIEPILSLRYGQTPPCVFTPALTVGNVAGQVVFECTEVEVFDIWTKAWVATPCGLQLVLQVL
jgi:hypothetical protein